MLRFISKPNAVRRIVRRFSESDFVSTIVRFKLHGMDADQIKSSIKDLKTADGFIATHTKLFLQLGAGPAAGQKEAIGEAYIKQASEVFSKPSSWGDRGESLKLFLSTLISGDSISKDQLRYFIHRSIINHLMIDDGKLSMIDIDVYVSIVENCVLADLMTADEIKACTKYALEKLQFSIKKARFIGKLAVVHALFLKKHKGKNNEGDYESAIDSLLHLINYTVKYLPTMHAQDALGSLLLLSHLNACGEVFQGHSKMPIFMTNWQLVDLEFQKAFKRLSDLIVKSLKEAPENELISFLEEGNSIGNLYLPESCKTTVLDAVLERLESNSRHTSSNLVAMLIGLCFKLDKDFEVSPKYLGALRVSTKDPVLQSLQNASTTLEIFAKKQLADHLMPFIKELESYLVELMAAEETRASAQQTKMLVGIFKQLAALNRGSVTLFKAFFEFFRHRQVLEQIGLMPILVQFLPALSAKTKRLGGAMATGNSEDQMTTNMSLATTISAEIKPALRDIWVALDAFICRKLAYIDLENLPAIMIQFVYGQVATSDLKVFNEISERLRGNMAKLTAKQLAQTVYTLVRTNLPQVREVINEGIAAFHQKTKDKPLEYSQERVTVLWSASKSANLDFKLYEQMLKTEIVNIEKYNDRIFVQLVNSIGVLSPDIETKTLKDLLEQMASFLEKNGRSFSLQVLLGCAYHILMFPQRAEVSQVYNRIYNEVSHLIGSHQKFMGQSFLLVYYTYLILCHRVARGAPPQELYRYNAMVAKYQVEILKNYAAAKKESVSPSESMFDAIVKQNKEQLGISEVEDEPNRVLECGKMNFLLMPASKVAKIVEQQQSLKDFPVKCLLVPYSVDILADDFAFEINGPFHYSRDSSTGKFYLNGHTKLKKEFIQSLGLKYIEVPFWNIDEMTGISDPEQIKLVKNLIRTSEDAHTK